MKRHARTEQRRRKERAKRRKKKHCLDERRTVRISLPFVRHRHLASFIELNPTVKLIFKLLLHPGPMSTPALIPGLHHKILQYPVKNVLFVVAVHAEPDESAAGERTLAREQFDVDVPKGGFEDDFSFRRRL